MTLHYPWTHQAQCMIIPTLPRRIKNETDLSACTKRLGGRDASYIDMLCSISPSDAYLFTVTQIQQMESQLSLSLRNKAHSFKLCPATVVILVHAYMEHDCEHCFVLLNAH